jgi:uncharacterized protein (TIGR00369 family)
MPAPATLDEFQSFLDSFTARLGFDDIVATLGLKPHAADGESLSMSIELTDAIAQASGMFSATALFGAADITGTLLAMQSYAGTGQFPLAVQSNINFMSNSKASPAVATARILRGGSTVAVAEVSVADADGKELVHSTFTYAIKDRAIGK